MSRGICAGSCATLVALIIHYLCFYIAGVPLWTDTIAQWIMARTPNQYAVWLLGNLGQFAKPLAMTGGLAALGFAVTLIALSRRWGLIAGPALALVFVKIFGYSSIAGVLSFWGPALAVTLALDARPSFNRSRRLALVMMAGTVAVAVESLIRNAGMAAHSAAPVELAPFQPPLDMFAPGLVRNAVTPVPSFYGMSKNTVDPAIDARAWRLRVTVDARVVRELTYADVLSLPHATYYATMRCISNTLKSDLMGTAQWTGIRLGQLMSRESLPPEISEVAIIGVDGHGDSLSVDYAYSRQTLFAIGMNGKSLDRVHGFPMRLMVPRYYGFKNVKWIGEIAFHSHPYFGTWPKMGYTREPMVHTGSFIDRILRSGTQLRIGGVSFAGDRGIRAVQVRADQGVWVDATLEDPLSPFTWRRWTAALDAASARMIQARAMDGSGCWQSDSERPLFPDGVAGPTVRTVG